MEMIQKTDQNKDKTNPFGPSIEFTPLKMFHVEPQNHPDEKENQSPKPQSLPDQPLIFHIKKTTISLRIWSHIAKAQKKTFGGLPARYVVGFFLDH